MHLGDSRGGRGGQIVAASGKSVFIYDAICFECLFIGAFIGPCLFSLGLFLLLRKSGGVSFLGRSSGRSMHEVPIDPLRFWRFNGPGSLCLIEVEGFLRNDKENGEFSCRE